MKISQKVENIILNVIANLFNFNSHDEIAFLSFNQQTGTISGTPGVSNVGYKYMVKIIIYNINT